ncbi:hypothetical protein ACFPRL_10305 [Pseudoclavibacter helvolus]
MRLSRHGGHCMRNEGLLECRCSRVTWLPVSCCRRSVTVTAGSCWLTGLSALAGSVCFDRACLQ